MGNSPAALAFDGESIWVANAADNTVSRLSLLGLALGTWEVGRGPVDLLYDGRSIWVASVEDDTLTRITLPLQ